MIIGFTGTRKGVTGEQDYVMAMIFYERLIRRGKIVECHHGDCLGSDVCFHNMCMFARESEFQIRMIVHPPIKSKWRANVSIDPSLDEVMVSKPYLERNIDIVNASEVMLATPGQEKEIQRSGTWATIRYAIRRGTRTIVIRPSGIITEYPAKRDT